MKKSLNEKALVAYSTAAGVAFVMAPVVNARIQANENVDLSFGVNYGGTKTLTMEGSEAEFKLSGDFMTGVYGLSTFQIGSNFNGTARVLTTTFQLALPLTTQQSVGYGLNEPQKGAGLFFYRYYSTEGYWTQNGDTKYIGVSFTDDDGAGTKVYGWIQVERLTGSAGKVLAWGYEDDGSAIKVGAVPEPVSGLGLLALGAAGVVAYRKRA